MYSKIFHKTDESDFSIIVDVFVRGNKNKVTSFFITELQNFSLLKGKEYFSGFYKIIKFLTVLYDNGFQVSDDVIVCLKKELRQLADFNNYEYHYYILSILFHLKSNDIGFYMEQYEIWSEKYQDLGSFYRLFARIFIKNNIASKLREVLCGLILEDVHMSFYGIIRDAWMFFVKLPDDKFLKNFLEILDFFDDEDIKKKLKNYHYQSFVSDKEHSEIIMIRLRQILNLEEKDSEKIKNFIIQEIRFIIKEYGDFKKSHYFITDLYKWIVKITDDENFLFKIIDDLQIENSGFYLLSGFIEEVLLVSQVEGLLQRFFKTHFHILVKIFSHFEKNNSTDLIKKFLDNAEFQEGMKQRQKQIQENDELSKQEMEKKYQKQKNEFTKVLELIEEKGFHPWIFQEFVKMQDEIVKIFPEKIEREKIIQKVRLQFLNALPTIKITQYDNDVLSRVSYERKGENSFTNAWEVEILKYIFCLATIFQYDISEYYKIFVLHFPFLHFSFVQVNVSQEELFDFLREKIQTDDIDYILKLYSEDLHENAKNLRYFSPVFLGEFYENFSSSFSDAQIQKIAEILKNFIFDADLEDIYVKARFFKIFCQVSNFEASSEIFTTLKKNFPDADYYRDVLLETNSVYRDNVRLLIQFATVLIHVFNDKNTLLWIIQMIRKQKIRVEDPYEKWNHRNRRYARAVSDLDSEFSLFRGDFGEIKYIFNKKGLKIDVFEEMFDVFCYSLDLQQEYISGGEYDYFAKYLQKLFIAYLENIDDSIRNGDWYFRIKSHLDNYDERVLYKIDISAIRKIFGLTSRDEEVGEILLSQDRRRIETLLKIESEYFLLKQEKNIKRFSSENPICLFVEGKTDENILYTAWEKLYSEEEMFFDIRFTMGSGTLRAGFDYANTGDVDFSKSCPHQICVGMLDFDDAFKEYEKLKTGWNIDNNFPNFVKSFVHSDGKKSYVFLLPVPKFRENYASMEIGALSKLSVEFLFPDEVFSGEGNKFVQKQKFYYPSGDIELLKFNDGKKYEFSQYVRFLPAENFVNFIPIFDILRKIRGIHIK